MSVIRPHSKDLLILGASCRAAAQCAHRKGFCVVAADQFHDRDLLACATPISLDRLFEPSHAYRDRLAGATALLCGGAENHPEWIEWLEHASIPCGLTSKSLGLLRSVSNWRAWAEDAGMNFPETLHPHEVPCGDVIAGEWLIKSESSAGGLGVDDWPDSAPIASGYVQRKVTGDQIGVSFLSDGESSEVIGGSFGIPSAFVRGPLPYIYRGSIGPVPLSREEVRSLIGFADHVRMATGIRGVWQADFIRNSAGWWLLEINPRWSSSMELLEAAMALDLITMHVQAVRGDRVSLRDTGAGCLESPSRQPLWLGKAIR